MAKKEEKLRLYPDDIFEVDYETLPNWVERMEDMVKLYGEDATIKGDWDWESFNITIRWEREETPREKEIREEKEKRKAHALAKRNATIRKKEMEQLAKLKAKYEEKK